MNGTIANQRSGGPRPARAEPTFDQYTLGGAVLAVVTALCFLPYLSFGPISAPSQVQPWAALMAWTYVVVRTIGGGLKVSRVQLALIVFSVWFMVYVYEGQGFEISNYFRKSAAFLLSAGIFLAMQYQSPTRLWRVLKFTMPIWFGFAALRYVDADLYFKLVTAVVPSVVDSVERGSSSLAPEATDFGFNMAFAILFIMIVRRLLKDQGKHPEIWPLYLAIGGAVLSKSGTGFFGMALIFLLNLAISRSRKTTTRVVRYGLFALAAVSAFFVLTSLPDTGVRGLDLASTAARSPGDLINSTASYRIVHNTVGVIGVWDSHFKGFGAGAFEVEGPRIYNRYNLGNVLGLTGWYASNMEETLATSPLAFFPVILLEYGAVGMLYIFVLFRFVARSEIPYRAVAFTLMVVTWAQSFPAAWPPFWVLLGLMMSPHFKSRDEPEPTAERDYFRPPPAESAIDAGRQPA